MAYAKYLHYDGKIMPESIGQERPCIVALEWNREPTEIDKKLNSIIAVAIPTQVRVLGEYRERTAVFSWSNMVKRKYPGNEVRYLKWNPHGSKHLAIGIITKDGNSIVELLEWKENKFKLKKAYEVSKNRNLSSLSWKPSGTHLLATLSPDNGVPKGVIVVLDISDTPREPVFVTTDYKVPFFAVFNPQSVDFIFTMQSGASGVQVWGEIDEKWIKLKKLRAVHLGVKAICFNPRGDQLAAIEHHEETNKTRLRVWNCSCKTDGTAIPIVTMRACEVDHFKDDGIRRKGEEPNLEEHCSAIMSLDFSIPGTIVTGSSRGSVCVHQSDTGMNSKKRYSALCFKSGYIQQYYYQEDITCVANEPLGAVKSIQRIATGGTDGIFTLWMLTYNPKTKFRTDEIFDRKCYLPEFDVEYYTSDAHRYAPSIESIPTDRSSSDDEEKPPRQTDERQESEGGVSSFTEDANSTVLEVMEVEAELGKGLTSGMPGEKQSQPYTGELHKSDAMAAEEVHKKSDAVAEEDGIIDVFGLMEKLQITSESDAKKLEAMERQIHKLQAEAKSMAQNVDDITAEFVAIKDGAAARVTIVGKIVQHLSSLKDPSK